MRIADPTLTRLRVLKAIRRHAPLARSDLPALTGISAGTISHITRDLVHRGLLVEAKEKTKRRNGRPRTLMQINAAGALILGASLTERGRLNVTFTDLTGEKLAGTEVALSYPSTMDEFALDFARALERAIATSPFDCKAITRIGIAIPALTDSRSGVVHQLARFPPGSVPFAETIGNRLGVPVAVEHEMICMSRAEHWFGRTEELDRFTLIHVGHYLGSCEFAGGLPRIGANGINAQLGHVKTAFGQHAPRCFCGQRGCASAFSSMYGMIQNWGRLPELTADGLRMLRRTFETFLGYLDAGDPEVCGIVEQAATHLGVTVANHINASDPGSVMILTDEPSLQQAMADRVTTIVEQNVLPGIWERTAITFGTVNRDWRSQGTAALALERLYLDEEISLLDTDPFSAEIFEPVSA